MCTRHTHLPVCEHTPQVSQTYTPVSLWTYTGQSGIRTCQSVNIHHKSVGHTHLPVYEHTPHASQTYTPVSLWTYTTQSDIHTYHSVNMHNSVRHIHHTPQSIGHTHTHLSAWEYNYFWHVTLDLHHLNVTWLVDWPLQMWNTGRYRHISIHESHNQKKRRKKRRKELETNVSTRVRLTFTIFNLCRGVVR